MAILIDPDDLSQGLETVISLTFSGQSGAAVDIAGTSIENIATQYDYFEIRDHSTAVNNGLYWVNTVGSNTINATKVAGDGGNPADASAESASIFHDDGTAGEEKSVYIDVYNREIWLLKQGNLTNDGVSLQAIYSFCKEEWKNDDTLIPHPFPFTAITPEQFEMTSDWIFHSGVDASGDGTNDVVQDIETRKLVRTGGWREIGTDGVLDKEYVGVITLGSFEDETAVTGDKAYYQQGNDPTSTGDTTDFQFTGPVNEAILSYNYLPSDLGTVTIASNVITRSTGSWITDGYKKGGKISVVASDNATDLGTGGIPRDYDITAITATDLTVSPIGGAASLTDEGSDNATFAAAVNNRNVLNVFLRVRDADTNGKTYAKSTLSDIGVSGDVDNKVFRFPVTNATDLKISETDANISTTTPYTQVRVRYFDDVYTKNVDDKVANARNFGIVIDVGTHSGIDGATTGGSNSVVTTAEAGITTSKGAGTYVGGTITIHGGTNKGTYDITAEADGQVTTDATLSSDTGMDFTLQRATPITATLPQIYEAVQYQLRQNSDINFYGTADQNVVGKTADELLTFVGDNLYAGTSVVTTPSNPNDGGSNYRGVIIEGFQTSDTNSVFFYDNTGTVRQFPFVAAGRIVFNQNLIDDADSKYWMFYEYTARTTTTNAVTATVSGQSVTFTTTDGAVDLPDLSGQVGEYINVQGFTPSSNLDGIYRVTSVTDTTTGGFVAYKLAVPDGALTTTTSSGGDVYFDENPIDSPSALLVQDNAGPADITGTVSGYITDPDTGAYYKTFDYDYNNNSQGARVAPGAGTNNPAVIVRAIGFNSAQFVQSTGSITRSTSIVISLVSALERNYSNPT